MAPQVSTIDIARRSADVFTFVTDPLHFAEWQHDVVSVRMLDNSRFTTTRRVGGAERTMTQQIIRNDPPRSWAAQGIDGPDPSARYRQRRADQRRHHVTGDVHAQFRRPRNRHTTAAARTPAGAERCAGQLPQPQDAPRS